MFTVNNRSTRARWEIYPKLTIKTPERCWTMLIIVNFEQNFTSCSSVSIVNFEHVIAGWVWVCSRYYLILLTSIDKVFIQSHFPLLLLYFKRMVIGLNELIEISVFIMREASVHVFSSLVVSRVYFERNQSFLQHDWLITLQRLWAKYSRKSFYAAGIHTSSNSTTETLEKVVKSVDEIVMVSLLLFLGKFHTF